MSDILLGKLATEFKTVKAMVEVYCHDHHGTKRDLCSECHELLEYAEVRLDRCPYGENKPTCNKCPIHCYKPEPKEQMRLVMRYSGPRMLLKHPSWRFVICFMKSEWYRKACSERVKPSQAFI